MQEGIELRLCLMRDAYVFLFACTWPFCSLHTVVEWEEGGSKSILGRLESHGISRSRRASLREDRFSCGGAVF
jgi:hypothetical protein